MLPSTSFSFNDAYRIIKNVIDERITTLTKSGAGIEVTWGTVAGIDNPPNTCSVYLPGETIPSTGFRLENGIMPNLLDPVRVSIDKRGNRWVDAILNSGSTAYAKMEIDPRDGQIRVGNGTSAPQPLVTQADLPAAIPSGVIVMWSGTIGAIPSGWALCNGSNGTPDLRDRFVVGEGTTPGGTGGTISPTAALATHDTHASHAAHAHRLPFGDNGTANMGWTTGGFGHSGTLAITGIVTFTAAGGNVSAMLSETSPAESHDAHSAHGIYKYYKIAFIMKL